MKPKFVTFTGIDIKTDLDRCQKLSDTYPIEWGILFGESESHPNRYLNYCEIVDIIGKLNGPLSAHFCGSYVSDVLKFKYFTLDPKFTRLQLNARDYDLEKIYKLRDREKYREIILQTRDSDFPVLEGVYSLFDISGGRGITPTEYPVQPLGMGIVGYSGGIGPHNVLNVMDRIDAHYFWLCMETFIRTDDWLDLDKCQKICELIWG